MAHLTQSFTSRGPLVDVIIGVSDARSATLRQLERGIPSSQKVRALLDTGASNSMADAAIVAALQLSPVARVSLHTPSTHGEAAFAAAYDVSLVVPNSFGMDNALEVANLRVSASRFAAGEPFQVLIGRDVLAHCLFIYNGSAGTFSLAY